MSKFKIMYQVWAEEFIEADSLEQAKQIAYKEFDWDAVVEECPNDQPKT